MLIRSKEKGILTNFNNCVDIFVNSNKIYVTGVDGKQYAIGEYQSRERCFSILDDIQQNYLFSISNIGKTKLYQMPEDDV